MPARPRRDAVRSQLHIDGPANIAASSARAIERTAQGAIRVWCRHVVRREMRLRLEGLQHVPARGPVLLVCRHFHHYFDGCALLATLPRFVHILVALDWVDRRPLRTLMEAACRLARWPVVLRRERLDTGSNSTFSSREVRGYLRAARDESVALLQAGDMLAIFPEAYPTVDPVYTPKLSDDAFLPFRAGFAHLAELAQRDGRTRVAIVPVGLHYEHGSRPRVTLRFGPPRYHQGRRARDELVRAIEADVHRLSNRA